MTGNSAGIMGEAKQTTVSNGQDSFICLAELKVWLKNLVWHQGWPLHTSESPRSEWKLLIIYEVLRTIVKLRTIPYRVGIKKILLGYLNDRWSSYY